MRCRICRREHFQHTAGRKCCVSLPRISFNFASISLSQQLCSWKMLLAGWGMSEKTLARRLSDEGLNFTEILQHLRRDLAIRYLDDRKLHVSKIAWLLGFTR